jgi:hypothetical protein
MSRWYELAYARAVIDMHITDDDPSFLTRLDPVRYVEMLRLSGADSAVVYAHSHVGLCNFPTRLGKTHPGLPDGALARVMDGCHGAGIAVVLYLSAIYDTWAYRTHPDWRMVDAAGNEAASRSRYGICCPNAPYREHIAGLVREVCEQYEFEGIRIDMTFWPRVCYCRHCRARFGAEVGGDPPTVIDWHDPRWVAFQRKREEWLIEFAHHLTATVRDARPGATVEHQASTFTHPWSFGVTHGLAAASDFLQGDFYGDALQGSFARKLFLSLSPNQPYGFETSVGVDLRNYTALKSPDLLRAKASAAAADAGAFVFIDSIDPVGVLNPAVFERMGAVFADTKRYAPFLGGRPCQDVAIYLSTESKCDFADNGKAVDGPGLSGSSPHVEAALGVARTLIEAHIPYAVITKRSLGDLGAHRLLVLPDVLTMDSEECYAVRDYVRGGGCVYASGWTSLVTKDGRVLDDFALGDVFGVRYIGRTDERFTYVSPTGTDAGALPGYTREWPLGVADRQFRLDSLPGAEVLATLTLPHFDPDDPERFASIHNNPPGRATASASVVRNRFGEGRAIYSAVPLERWPEHSGAFLSLVSAFGLEWSVEVAAPPCVEVTVFYQPERDRYLVSLLNFQRQLPNVPVRGIRVRLRTERPARSVRLVPELEDVPFTVSDGWVTLDAPELDTLLVFAVSV